MCVGKIAALIAGLILEGGVCEDLTIVNLKFAHVVITSEVLTSREKLPRSKEKFRLESDSGKRDGCSPTSPFSVAAGSLKLQQHPCEAVTRWMSIHLHKVCCCSHSCAESITVTHSR